MNNMLAPIAKSYLNDIVVEEFIIVIICNVVFVKNCNDELYNCK